MDESKLELKVGALLLAALVGTLTLLWLMGELTFGGGATVTIDFGHTGNVVRGAPVKLAGVPIGKVDSIQLLPTRRDQRGDPLPVQMRAAISKEAFAALRSDAVVTVSSQGPLGESYLEMQIGSATSAYDGSKPIRAIDAPRIDLVSNKLARFLESASAVLDKDPEALQRLVSGITGLSRTVDGVLTDNRDDVRSIAQELSAAAKDLKVLSATARAQMEPGGKALSLIDDASATAKVLRSDVPQLSTRAQVALSGLAAVGGQLTEDDGVKLKAALAHYAAAGEKLDTLAGRADRLLNKMEKGEGTMGALMNDKQAYDDLKSLLADLRAHPWKFLWKD